VALALVAGEVAGVPKAEAVAVVVGAADSAGELVEDAPHEEPQLPGGPVKVGRPNFAALVEVMITVVPAVPLPVADAEPVELLPHVPN
jgi:hypothetical protein